MEQCDSCYVERFFTRLFDTPELHIHSRKTKYRNKITYSLPVLGEDAYSELAEDRINDVCRAIQQWHHDDDSILSFREVMVKATRSGSLLVRATIQYHKCSDGCNGSRDCWVNASSFRDYLRSAFPAIECLCYNVANGSARPSKESPLHFLTDAVHVLESTPNGLDYQIGPDTFSEVNHEVELLQWEKTKEWLDALHASDSCDGTFDTSTASSAVLIVSGRDISSFGLGFGSLLLPVHSDNNKNISNGGERMFSHVVAIQHCPLVHRDALRNFERHKDKVNATVLHMSKPDMVHGFSQELQRRDTAGRNVVGVMTGGRKGLDPAYITYLVQNRSVVCIIYNSCATKSLLRDIKGFLDGGFYVKDFQSYDFLPGTGYTASLTKLVRRPRTLVIPVGPAGVGKSSLAQLLVQQCPSGVTWWQRDAIFASYRNRGIGLGKSKQLVHQDLLDCLQQRKQDDASNSATAAAAAAAAVIVVDSTNGNADARKLYVQEALPDLVILVAMKVEGRDNDDIVDYLLERTANRLRQQGGSCSASRHPSFPDTVDEQRKKHANIIKGIEYPGDSELQLCRRVRSQLISWDPRGQESLANLAYSIFLEFTASEKLRRAIKPS